MTTTTDRDTYADAMRRRLQHVLRQHEDKADQLKGTVGEVLLGKVIEVSARDLANATRPCRPTWKHEFEDGLPCPECGSFPCDRCEGSGLDPWAGDDEREVSCGTCDGLGIEL